jgi:hypothetical protein
MMPSTIIYISLCLALCGNDEQAVIRSPSMLQTIVGNWRKLQRSATPLKL